MGHATRSLAHGLARDRPEFGLFHRMRICFTLVPDSPVETNIIPSQVLDCVSGFINLTLPPPLIDFEQGLDECYK